MASKDLKIGNYDVYTNDLLIDPDTLDLIWAEDVDYIVQKILIRLQWFDREWYLDTSKGLPWFTDILVKNPNMPLIDSLIKAKIVGTPGVRGLIAYESSYNNATRALTIDFQVQADTGALSSNVSLTIGD